MTHDGACLRPRRVPGRLGPVGVWRLLGFQVIQLGLFFALAQGVWVAVLSGVVGLLAIVAAFGRWRGRWLSEIALLRLRRRLRRGAIRSTQADRRLAVLAELVPDLTVEEVPGPDGTRLGMGADGAGWFAVLEVEAGDGGADPPVPLAALAKIGAEAGVAGVIVQVLSHTEPALDSAGARQRRLWVAVRLDADRVAEAMVDDLHRPIEVPAVLAELTRRVRRALKRRGLATRVLDVDGLIDALMLSCDLTPQDTAGPGAGHIHEEWDAWHSPRLVHRCFWLRDWPDPDRATALLASLTELPKVRVSAALVLEPAPEAAHTDLRCLIRLSSDPATVAQLDDFVATMADRLGARLFPLDGEHALAVYASAPSGGGAR